MRFLPVLLLAAAAPVIQAADTKEFKKTVPLEANGRFSLDTYKGSIRITAWDQPNAGIQARIVEDTTSWISQPVEEVEIRVDSGPGNVRVKTIYHRKTWSIVEGSSPRVEYTIHVPRDASLSIKDYKSETEISGVQGDVEFQTYKGTARLDGLRRGLQLKTYKGDIRASFTSFGARSHIDTYRGTVELSLPRASAFEVHAELQRHATFDSDFPGMVHSSSRDRSFRSVVNGGGTVLHVTSYRGYIRLHSV